MIVKTTKIIRKDYFTQILLMFIVILVFFPPLTLVSILLLPFMIRRIRFIKRVFKNGQTISGVITQIRRDRSLCWIVRYAYTVDGKKFVTRNAMVGGMPDIDVDEPVQVVYDPKKPKDAFVPVLYSVSG